MVVALEERLHDHRARVLAGHVEAVRHLGFGGQADGDAAAVVAVVGLGDHREADAARGAHRLVLAVHQFLLRHRQAKAGEDLVGLLLVARQLHRDVGRASGDRRLDALLVLAVTELHQRLIVQAQPRDAAVLGGAHQRGRRGAERAALGEADELIARLRPVPAFRNAVGGAQLRRQQREQQAQTELAGGDALVALRVLVDHRVDPGTPGAARLAEGHFLAGDVLQLDGDVLEHVAEPGTIALAHAPQQPPRLAVGAAVLSQARERGRERIDEAARRGAPWATLPARRGRGPDG